MKKKWKPILHLDQIDYEDNYIDEEYIYKDVTINENLVTYNYFTCVKESLVIIQQFSLVSLYSIIFYLSLIKKISTNDLIISDFILIIFLKSN
jgi:hypothetical protein